MPPITSFPVIGLPARILALALLPGALPPVARITTAPTSGMVTRSVRLPMLRAFIIRIAPGEFMPTAAMEPTQPRPIEVLLRR